MALLTKYRELSLSSFPGCSIHLNATKWSLENYILIFYQWFLSITQVNRICLVNCISEDPVSENFDWWHSHCSHDILKVLIFFNIPWKVSWTNLNYLQSYLTCLSLFLSMSIVKRWRASMDPPQFKLPKWLMDPCQERHHWFVFNIEVSNEQKIVILDKYVKFLPALGTVSLSSFKSIFQ